MRLSKTFSRHDDETTTTDAPPPAAADADDASKEPKYDEATQALVDVASAARSEFDAADRVFRDLEREVQDLEKKLETDYGPGEFNRCQSSLASNVVAYLM